jgi:hypothetical protein
VLALVAADGHLGDVVQQDVGRHEHRVGQQRQAGAAATALLLELDHAVYLAVARDALEQVVQLGVRGEVRLAVQHRLPRVEAGGQQQARDLQRQLA